MLQKRYLICLLLVGVTLLGIFYGGAKSVSAQPQAVQISSFQITTLDGTSIDNQNLMAGATYNIKFTLEIAAGINNQIVLTTDLVAYSDHFWSLDAPYGGINTSTWQPGQSEISFNAVQGTAQFELKGTVPTDYVLTSLPTGETLHVSKPINLIQLSLTGGSTLDNRTQEVVDSSISTYQSTLANTQSLLKNSKADSRYIQLVSAIVTAAQKEGDAGYTERATTMLKSIPSSGWIQSQSSNLFLWIIIGILALLMLIGFFLMYKARSDVNFIKKKADEQAKRLEILASRVRGIGDTALAGEITKVKQDLEEISEK
jgi:hypothetical protein